MSAVPPAVVKFNVNPSESNETKSNSVKTPASVNDTPAFDFDCRCLTTEGFDALRVLHTTYPRSLADVATTKVKAPLVFVSNVSGVEYLPAKKMTQSG